MATENIDAFISPLMELGNDFEKLTGMMDTGDIIDDCIKALKSIDFLGGSDEMSEESSSLSLEDAVTLSI